MSPFDPSPIPLLQRYPVPPNSLPFGESVEGIGCFLWSSFSRHLSLNLLCPSKSFTIYVSALQLPKYPVLSAVDSSHSF